MKPPAYIAILGIVFLLIAAAPVDTPPHPETTGSINSADLLARTRAIADFLRVVGQREFVAMGEGLDAALNEGR